MAADFPTFSLTLPSDLRMITICRAFLEAVCQTCDMDRRTIHAIVLATGEAVTNVIRHAHRNQSEAMVQIHCRLGTNEVEICLLDEGDPFDISRVPHMDPAELRVGGRGVYLMRALMDELVCQPRGQRGNTLRMVKRWAQAIPIRECG